MIDEMQQAGRKFVKINFWQKAKSKCLHVLLSVNLYMYESMILQYRYGRSRLGISAGSLCIYM